MTDDSRLPADLPIRFVYDLAVLQGRSEDVVRSAGGDVVVRARGHRAGRGLANRTLHRAGRNAAAPTGTAVRVEGPGLARARAGRSAALNRSSALGSAQSM